MPASSIFCRYSSATERVVLAQLLADGLHLLAQEVLALLAVGALLDVVADLRPDLQLGEPLALQLERTRQPLGDVQGLEQPILCSKAEVGRVAGACPPVRRGR